MSDLLKSSEYRVQFGYHWVSLNKREGINMCSTWLPSFGLSLHLVLEFFFEVTEEFFQIKTWQTLSAIM
jgi:hypothetical protein